MQLFEVVEVEGSPSHLRHAYKFRGHYSHLPFICGDWYASFAALPYPGGEKGIESMSENHINEMKSMSHEIIHTSARRSL